jgi:hemolysin activation/secretion protein
MFKLISIDFCKRSKLFWLSIFLQILNTSVLAQSSPDVDVNSMDVEKIEFIGNEVFTDRELEQAITPLPNHKISFQRLLQIRAEITDFYVNQGYISSGAILTEQEFANGTVQIRIIEGILEEIEVEGLNKLHKSYIAARLPLGKPLNKYELSRDLAELSKDPSIKSISSELVRLTPGKNNLIINIKENKALETQFTISNDFSPSVGNWGGLAIASYHLLGYGDRLALSYSLTNKVGLSRYGINYSIPFNSQNGTIALSYSNANSKIVEEPISSALDIQSDLEAYKLSIKQPIDIGINDNLSLEIGLERIQTQSSIDDVSFGFTKGLPDGEINLSALRLAQEFSTVGTKNYFLARSQFNLGLGIFDSTVTEAGIDSLYWSWQGQAKWIKKLDEINLVSNLNVQLSNDSLLPIEQFSLGGNEQVRGYRENLSIGDNGVIGSFEVEIPIIKFSDQKSVIKIVPFVDGGTIWNHSEQKIQADTLFSTGMGLSLEIKDSFQARIDYGIPLTDTEFSNDFAQQELTFGLRYQP